MPKLRAVIFVNGCFWHRHPNCKFAYTPKSNVATWEKKFHSNVARDNKNAEALRAAGWNVVVVWECEISDTTQLADNLQQALKCSQVGFSGRQT